MLDIEDKNDLLGWPHMKSHWRVVYLIKLSVKLCNALQEKFKVKKIDITNSLNIVQLNSKINLGPFTIDFVTLTHSILEPNGLSITTPSGTILHTGDWKVDPNPMIGENIDKEKLIEIGKKGVMAMICDSTNVFSEGRAGSEQDVRKSLINN